MCTVEGANVLLVSWIKGAWFFELIIIGKLLSSGRSNADLKSAIGRITLGLLNV